MGGVCEYKIYYVLSDPDYDYTKSDIPSIAGDLGSDVLNSHGNF